MHPLVAVKRQDVHSKVRPVLATTAFFGDWRYFVLDPVIVALPDRFRLGLSLIGLFRLWFEEARFVSARKPLEVFERPTLHLLANQNGSCFHPLAVLRRIS